MLPIFQQFLYDKLFHPNQSIEFDGLTSLTGVAVK